MDKFDGFNKQVTKSFTRAFYGVEIEIGDVKFVVTESLMLKLPAYPEEENDGLKIEAQKMKNGELS